jgi:hypothetical protein
MRMIEPDPVTADTMREAFERVARGEGLRATARCLADFSRGNDGWTAWSEPVLAAALRSPTYVARPAVGDADVLSRTPARWQALVSDELWSRVQQRLASHTRPGRTASGRYLLTGLLRCPRCDARLGATSDKAHRLGSYRCVGHCLGANAPDPACRWRASMRGADRAVLDAVGEVLDVLSDADRWPLLRQTWQRQQRGTRDATSVQLAALQRDEQRLTQDLADAGRFLIHGGDRATFEALRDDTEARLREVRAARARLQPVAPVRAEPLPSLDRVLRDAGGWRAMLDGGTVAHQRAVLEQLVSQARLRRDGRALYTADVTWTPLGQWLSDLAQAQPQAAEAA